jgi:hypothetical protein
MKNKRNTTGSGKPANAQKPKVIYDRGVWLLMKPKVKTHLEGTFLDERLEPESDLAKQEAPASLPGLICSRSYPTANHTHSDIYLQKYRAYIPSPQTASAPTSTHLSEWSGRSKNIKRRRETQVSIFQYSPPLPPYPFFPLVFV